MAPLIFTTVDPVPPVTPFGEISPSPAPIVQSVPSLRITNIVFFVFDPVSQNGQVLALKSTEVMSKSAEPPVHKSGSDAGSSPLNEKAHVFDFKSMSTYRLRPGQFESYTITLAMFFEGYSIANGVTACPPDWLYRPSV